jgi:hypothetical protein
MTLSKLMGMAEWKMVGAGERLCRVSLGRGRKPSLGVVLAAWDPGAASESLDLVLERLRGLKGVNWSMVVVANNSAVARTLPRNGDYRLLSGSNREAEFSAYEEGRQYLLGEAGPAPDAWVILNDRLPFYRADCLSGITPALLQFAASVPMAAGTVDFLPGHFPLRGRDFPCYIRSNYLLLSAAAIDRAGSLCAISADDYAGHVPVTYPGRDRPLSTWLGQHLGGFLLDFLTKPGSMESWSRAEPLTEASWPRLRMKALSIINEWWLSLRLIEAEVPLVPWRLARAMSGLTSSETFSQRLLGQYKVDPGFGGALEPNLQGRLSLTAAMLAGRAGAGAVGERFLASAARFSNEARAVEKG